jgi:predicted kinase
MTVADPREGVLTVVCGAPGVGKTTVSGLLADRLGADRLRTDVVRKELFEDPTYTDTESDRVYAALFDRAAERLPRPVVLDGTFHERRRRDRARSLASANGTGCRLVHVVCGPAVVRERIADREDDASDADHEIARQIRAAFESVREPPTVVDNSGSH